MPTQDERDYLEHERRMQQMLADTELKKIQALKVDQDWRFDPARVLIQAVLATAAIIGALAGLLGFLLGRAH